MLTLLKRWLNAPLWANQSSSSSNASKTSRNKTKLGLGVVFAVGALCASLHGAAAAPGPAGRDPRGDRQGLHLKWRRRVPRHSLRRAAARQSALEAAEEPCALGRRPDDAGLRADLRADHDARRVRRPANNNEDCLYLNVFTPNLDPSARLPVIVWIHGGGNVDGETPGYDGSKMASDGKTVVVTIDIA